jgi:hypothetical protein
VWETFVFAQLRHRGRRAGRHPSLFFWRDRTREVDFLVDVAGRIERYEARWSELPSFADAVNLTFVKGVVGPPRVRGGGIVCRARNRYPLSKGFHALPVPDLV